MRTITFDYDEMLAKRKIHVHNPSFPVILKSYLCSKFERNSSFGPGHAKMCLMTYANNKGADQPAQSDQHLCCSLLR